MTFNLPDDLLEVRGIGRAVLPQVASQLTFGLQRLAEPLTLYFALHGSHRAPEVQAAARHKHAQYFQRQLASLERGRGIQCWLESSPSLTPSYDMALQYCARLAQLTRHPASEFLTALTTPHGTPYAIDQLRQLYDRGMNGLGAAQRSDPIAFLRAEDEVEFGDLLEQAARTRKLRVRFESPSFEDWRQFSAAKRAEHDALALFFDGDHTDRPLELIARYATLLRDTDRTRDQRLAREIAGAVRESPYDLHLVQRGSAHTELLTAFLAEAGVPFNIAPESDRPSETMDPIERYGRMNLPSVSSSIGRAMLISHFLYTVTMVGLREEYGALIANNLSEPFGVALAAVPLDTLEDWWIRARSLIPRQQSHAPHPATYRWLQEHVPDLPEQVQQMLRNRSTPT